MMEEEKELVLARFRTLDPESTIYLTGRFITVKEIIEHIEAEDKFGKRIVQVQMEMFKLWKKMFKLWES